MGLREFTAVLAIITITAGCSGVVATFATAAIVRRSRGQGWGHFVGRVLRLTLVLTVGALLAQSTIVIWDLTLTI